MPIKIIDFVELPIMQEDGSLKNEPFATIGFFNSQGERYGGLRVRVAELPEGSLEGDDLALTKSS